MRNRIFILLLCILPWLAGCRYVAPEIDNWDVSSRTRDSLSFFMEHHYTLNTNFEVNADSILLEQLPVLGQFKSVKKGDRLVVAEFMIQPADSVDSVWVKVARDQETQGWIRESDLLDRVLPDGSVSRCIYWFSDAHSTYFAIFLLLFTILILLRTFLKNKLRPVSLVNVDSIFPLLLCYLMAFSATVYASMQLLVPETWEHFYYNPSLNPFKLPALLGIFVASVWAVVIVSLAVLEDLFRQVSISNGLFYLLTLISACIVCYLFFTVTVLWYVGYLFFFLFTAFFILKILKGTSYKYRCGRCGSKLLKKGECPHCGAINN